MRMIQKIRFRLMTIGLTLDNAIRTLDRNHYKRDEKGRFAKENKPKNSKQKKKHNQDRRRKKFHLSERVRSELNTHLSKEQRKQKIVHKAIGNYLYIVENNGFDDYNIIGRMKLK